MDIKNKVMFRLLLGFTLGLIIGIIMYLAFIPDGSPVDKKFLILQLIGSALLGVVGYGGAVVYDIESWSLGKATLIHYIASFTVFFIDNTILGWFPGKIILAAFFSFTAAYVLIWFIEYLGWKKQVRQMNQTLDAMLKTLDRRKDTE